MFPQISPPRCARVASGQFANENETVAAALGAAEDEEAGIDAWLKGPVCETYDAVIAGTTTLRTLDEVREESLGRLR